MGRRRILARHAGIAVIVAALSAAAFAEVMAETVARNWVVPRGALVAPGEMPDLTLLYTGNVIGYLEDCGCKRSPAGGVARRSWLIEQLQENYAGSGQLLMDCGNFSDNPTPEGDVKTRALVEAMSRMGYRAANVGERDLVLGYDELRKRTEPATFPLISTNIVREDTGDPVFDPYVILSATRPDGETVRIGVMGVVRFSPLFLKAGPEGSNLVTAPAAEMVSRYVDEVRQRSDLVILLAALHKDDAHAIAREVAGLDVILGTYGGIYSRADDREGDTEIFYTGNQGKRIAETRLFLDDDHRIRSTTSFQYHLTPNYPDDPEMRAFVDEVNARMNDEASDEARESGAEPRGAGAGRVAASPEEPS